MASETTGKVLGVSLDAARKVIRAGQEKAKEIGVPMNIAVVDAGANLVAFERMEGAWIGSIDIAINKAFTSRAFDIETKALGENSQSGDQFFGIHASNHGRIMIFAGGVPLKLKGQVVGAVGVSGGLGKQDQAVAEAAADSIRCVDRTSSIDRSPHPYDPIKSPAFRGAFTDH